MEQLPLLREVALSDKRKKELEDALHEMKHTANAFYLAAQDIGVHTFLEFTGFMNEYIKHCAIMLANGKDFQTEPLRFQSHEMAYIAEKVDCIWGESLRDKRARRAFARTLADKGGWSVYSFMANKKEQARRSSSSMKVAEVADGEKTG